jgi:hypothetical protein
MFQPDTAAWSEMTFKSYKFLYAFNASISQALWQNISSLGFLFYLPNNRKSTKANSFQRIGQFQVTRINVHNKALICNYMLNRQMLTAKGYTATRTETCSQLLSPLR